MGYAENGIDTIHAVVISNCSNDGHIESWHTVGGIAGRLYKYHTVKNCINHGEIVATREYDLEAEKQYLTTSSAAAGIVGQTYQNCVVENCVNTANVSGLAADCGGIVGCVLGPVNINNVYNNGNVTGFMYVAGLIGDVYSGSYYGGKPTMTNAYTTGSVTATREATTYYSNICGYSQNAWTAVTNCFFPDTLAAGKYDKTEQQASMAFFVSKDMVATLGSAYVWNEAAFPMLSLFSDDAEAQLWAAYYQVADGDSATHITNAVTLPQLSQLKWSATGAMTIQDGKAVPTAKGEATLTVTNGTNSRTFAFVCDPASTIKGDVNGDGKVDVSDVTTLINVILGTTQSQAADVNEDGTVDVSDVTALINIILGM